MPKDIDVPKEVISLDDLRNLMKVLGNKEGYLLKFMYQGKELELQSVGTNLNKNIFDKEHGTTKCCSFLTFELSDAPPKSYGPLKSTTDGK